MHCYRVHGGGMPVTASCAKAAVGTSKAGAPASDSSSMGGKNRFLTPAVPMSGAAAP